MSNPGYPKKAKKARTEAKPAQAKPAEAKLGTYFGFGTTFFLDPNGRSRFHCVNKEAKSICAKTDEPYYKARYQLLTNQPLPSGTTYKQAFIFAYTHILKHMQGLMKLDAWSIHLTHQADLNFQEKIYFKNRVSFCPLWSFRAELQWKDETYTPICTPHAAALILGYEKLAQEIITAKQFTDPTEATRDQNVLLRPHGYDPVTRQTHSTNTSKYTEEEVRICNQDMYGMHNKDPGIFIYLNGQIRNRATIANLITQGSFARYVSFSTACFFLNSFVRKVNPPLAYAYALRTNLCCDENSSLLPPNPTQLLVAFQQATKILYQDQLSDLLNVALTGTYLFESATMSFFTVTILLNNGVAINNPAMSTVFPPNNPLYWVWLFAQTLLNAINSNEFTDVIKLAKNNLSMFTRCKIEKWLYIVNPDVPSNYYKYESLITLATRCGSLQKFEDLVSILRSAQASNTSATSHQVDSDSSSGPAATNIRRLGP